MALARVQWTDSRIWSVSSVQVSVQVHPPPEKSFEFINTEGRPAEVYVLRAVVHHRFISFFSRSLLAGKRPVFLSSFRLVSCLVLGFVFFCSSAGLWGVAPCGGRRFPAENRPFLNWTPGNERMQPYPGP